MISAMKAMAYAKAIGGGGGSSNVETGSFTVPDSGSDHTVTLENKFTECLIFTEATEESKAAILESGASGPRAFAHLAHFPGLSINEGETPEYVFAYRINPSTSELGFANAENYLQYGDKSMTVSVGSFSTGANYYYKGCTYNYVIFKIK